MGKVAGEFSASISYTAGDLCIYNGLLYEFTANHSGAWDDSDVTAADESKQIDITRIEAGYHNAIKASDYADAIVFEPQQIEGTRYKYILSNIQPEV